MERSDWLTGVSHSFMLIFILIFVFEAKLTPFGLQVYCFSLKEAYYLVWFQLKGTTKPARRLSSVWFQHQGFQRIYLQPGQAGTATCGAAWLIDDKVKCLLN